MKTTLTVASLAVLITACGWVGFALNHQNAAVRQQIATLRSVKAPPAAPSPATARESSRFNAAPAGAPEEAALRAEIARLEARAAQQYAAKSAVGSENARDPERGMTRLENLKNVGQATPAAAFQTLAWAALHGDDKTMGDTIALDDTARALLQDMLAKLPDDQRQKYGTPEALAALFLAKALINVSAIHITETTWTDPQHATITIAGLLGNAQTLPMRLGPRGWQLWEGRSQVQWIQGQLAGARE